jgi:heme exporter protein A
MSTTTPAVESEDVCRRFGTRWALVDVRLSVTRGETFVLTGRNGSGKSTLLRVVATALRPHRGTARVEGLDVRTRRDAVRTRLSLLGHHSNLYEPLTARENLEVMRAFLDAPGRPDAVMHALDRVGLAERADDVVSTFSSGMRKRLQLARLFVKPAPLVLLDEPFAALDPAGFRLVEELIAEQKARGATVMMATHLLERARELGDEAVVLAAGRVSWRGPARELPPAEVGP